SHQVEAKNGPPWRFAQRPPNEDRQCQRAGHDVEIHSRVSHLLRDDAFLVESVEQELNRDAEGLETYEPTDVYSVDQPGADRRKRDCRSGDGNNIDKDQEWRGASLELPQHS